MKDCQLASLSWCQALICLTIVDLLMWGVLSDERMGLNLLLGLTRAVTLRFKSCITHDHILLSHLRLSRPGGPGPRIYIPPGLG
jgi:hypothetical protein